MTLTRSELIEKARAFGYNVEDAGWAVDFCLPLLAAERERAIEEAAQACEGITYDMDGSCDRQIETRNRCQARVRALARANEKEQPPAAARASLARTEGDAVKSEESSAVPRAADRNTGDGSNPSAGGHSPTQRQRAEELLRVCCLWSRNETIDAMLAYGAEREAAANQGELERRAVACERAHARGAREALNSICRYLIAESVAAPDGEIVAEIDRRLAALSRPGETDKPEGTERSSSASGAVTLTPALSDAAVLERAAEIMGKHAAPGRHDGWNAHVLGLREMAGRLRARFAPPAPDVFDEFVAEHWPKDESQRAKLAATIRERFAPLVEALESYTDTHLYGRATITAEQALSRLRTTAKEEGK